MAGFWERILGKPSASTVPSRPAVAAQDDNSLLDSAPFLREAKNAFAFPILTHSLGGSYRFKQQSLDRPDDVQRLFVAMSYATSLLRHKRGYPVRNELNRLIPAECVPDLGFVVERNHNDDGTESLIVAFDIVAGETKPMMKFKDEPGYKGPMERMLAGGGYDDFKEADELGLAFLDSKEWNGQCYAWQYLGAEWSTTVPSTVPSPVLSLQLRKVTIGSVNPNPFAPRSTQHGQAQFAWIDEIASSNATHVVTAAEGDGAPLGLFATGDWVEGGDQMVLARTKGQGHRLIVGPTRSGKFTSAVAPLLLSTDDASIVVFDVADGEAARVTSAHRAKLGEVLILDPFDITGFGSGSLNPLDLLRADDPNILEAAKRLGDALFVVEGKGDSNASYFNDQARDVLTSLLLHVATSLMESDRTLRRLREIIRRPFTPELLAAMLHNPVAGGVVSDTARNIEAAERSDADKNTFYVTQSLRANTAFLDLPSVQNVTATTSFDLAGLRSAVSTLYICLPEYQLQPVSRWLRLIYTVVMEQMRMTRTAGSVPLHVAIDEFPAFGSFPRVAQDMAIVGRAGIHFHVIVQSLAQLEGLYGSSWQTFCSNARWQQVLGANDAFTADYVSKRLGKTTVPTTSESHSRASAGGSQNTSRGWAAADLMAPDEVSRLPAHEALVLIEGQNPLRLRKWHYYQDETLSGRASAP